MSDELFAVPESPLPQLAKARIELERAIIAEQKANEAYDEADEYEMSPREYSELERHVSDAEYNREVWEKAVERFEREEIRK